jgi:hypothetical protein
MMAVTLIAVLIGTTVHAPGAVIISLIFVSPFLMAAFLASISNRPDR